MRKWFPIIIIFTVILSACFSGYEDSENDKNKKQASNWEKIKKRGRLIAVTEYNSTDYFIYRGQPMGFQYELLTHLSEYLGLELEIVLSNDLDDSFVMLKDGEYDLMAINLTITSDRKKQIDFTTPIGQTRQILVQRKPDGWSNMRFKEYDSQMIRSRLDLAKKDVFVKSNTAFAERLKSLSEEIGDTIYIHEMENYSVEEIIELVANGDLPLTVCDENVAKVNSTYHPNIDIKTNLSFSQNVAWGVQKGADSLRYYLNLFLTNNLKKKWFANLYNKYYRNPKSSQFYNSEFLSLNGSRISEYDDIIKKYSKKIGWDWRMVASLIYQESRFNPQVESWSGASGLMQLMPGTAERFGINEESSTAENIKGGTKFLSWLDDQLKPQVPDSIERVKFVLASYNVGLGHVQDAIRLAKKNNKDTAIWDDNVAYYLLHKSNPKYYNDPVVKYGYCRGSEPYNYVADVVKRYNEYIKVIHD
ncbi:MAG: transporter substrate-binding domain-containing protein [Bacteroidales bacterium]|nr:transporter substrate-binding domain-containing protein [Bacteroidales bacterium]